MARVGSSDPGAARPVALARVLAAVVEVLLAAGVFAAVMWPPGIWLVLAGVGALFASHLAVGIVGYRSVMRRTWPSVEPLPDEDEW